ncbi:MAG: SDR family oxidoreductase [Gemmatimonadota bacterium]|nr:SDR family oxidoreductase [Gemmatimonadota bacterium]
MITKEPRFTVLGGRGFIGAAMARFLREKGYACQTPKRGDESIYTVPLGHVIYAIGLTADFRTRPFDTVEAHVCILRRLLQEGTFSSLVYLSSTRVYADSSRTDEEAPVLIDVTKPASLYNVSKLMGESLCLHCGKPEVRIARLSNVVGLRSDTDIFVDQLLAEGFERGEVELRTTYGSTKDYIHIDEVVPLLARLALGGEHNVYNLASGVGVSNKQIVDLLAACAGIRSSVTNGAESWPFFPIDTTRIGREFGFIPRPFAEYFPRHIQEFKQRHIVRG